MHCCRDCSRKVFHCHTQISDRRISIVLIILSRLGTIIRTVAAAAAFFLLLVTRQVAYDTTSIVSATCRPQLMMSSRQLQTFYTTHQARLLPAARRGNASSLQSARSRAFPPSSRRTGPAQVSAAGLGRANMEDLFSALPPPEKTAIADNNAAAPTRAQLDELFYRLSEEKHITAQQTASAARPAAFGRSARTLRTTTPDTSSSMSVHPPASNLPPSPSSVGFQSIPGSQCLEMLCFSHGDC